MDQTRERQRELVVHVHGRELPDEDLTVAAASRHGALARGVLLAAALGLFVIALGLMRAGASALVPVLEGSAFTDTAWSTLGMGWVGACLVLSGSPVAASALSLLDGGAIDRLQAFTMVTGSRLGAAFVVLVAGAVYALRGTAANRRAPVSIGVLSLLMTFAAYVPGAALGYLVLQAGAFDAVEIGGGRVLTSITDVLFGWAVDAFDAVLPAWALFPAGVAVLLVGFWVFDRVLPEVSEHRLERRGESWFDRKWAMFGVGAAVCLLTLSVSVALTVLVPLVARGHLRRANTLPYIAGANITTLADTFAVAVLLGDAGAVQAVLAVTVSVSVWTLVLLGPWYAGFRRLCLGIARAVLASQPRLAAFVLALLLVPAGLIVA